MRYRKGRGKKKSQVTLSQTEIIEACRQYVKNEGYKTASLTRICVPIEHEKRDSLGRKREVPVTVEVEIEDELEQSSIIEGDPRVGSTYNPEYHGDY